jgi:hypothetical protein
MKTKIFLDPVDIPIVMLNRGLDRGVKTFLEWPESS